MRRGGEAALLTRIAAVAAGLAARSRLDWWCFCLAALCGAIAVMAGHVPPLELTARVTASSAGGLQVYRADETGFSEFRSTVTPLAAGQQEFSARIPHDESESLRIDPAPGAVRTAFCDMWLHLPDGFTVPLDPSRFKAANQAQVSAEQGCAAVLADPAAPEPQVHVDLTGSIRERIGEVRRSRLRVALFFAVLATVFLVAGGAYMRAARRAAIADSELEALGRALPKVYVVLAMVLGGLFCFVTPPGAVPDEPAHIAKTVLVENANLIGAAPRLDPGMGTLLGPFGDFLNPARRFTAAQALEHARQPLNCVPETGSYPSSAQNYAPTMYVPGAMVLNLACHFQAPTGVFLYGARLANLALAVLLVFLGMRAAGAHVWPVFAVAMLPMVLYEQASFSADSIILGLTLCMVGTQVGLASCHLRPSRTIEIALLALGMGLAFSKPGYAWICVGFLFCWRAYRDAGRPFWPRALLLVALPWLIHTVWVLMSVESAAPQPGVDPAANLASFVHSPGRVAKQWWTTFLGEASPFVWSSLAGRLGWLDVVLHPGAYGLIWVALVLSLGMRGASPGAPHRSSRAWAVALALGAACLPALPMYLFWTPASALGLEGMQGRYLIPSLAFVLAWLAFRAHRLWRLSAAPFLLLAPVAANLDGIYRVALRYFG